MNRTRSNRRILLLCTLLVCLVSMLMIRFSAAAEENVIPETRQLPRLVDRADLLSELEEEELEARLDEISERQQADVVVVTVNSLDGKSAQDYADDFYDYNGKPIFGELTFTPAGCIDKNYTDEAQLKLGELINLK